MTTATATLDILQQSFDAAASAPATVGAPVGWALGDFAAKAKAFREVLAILRAAGVADDSILGKIGEILTVIINNLPDILRIIALVSALFGL